MSAEAHQHASSGGFLQWLRDRPIPVKLAGLVAVLALVALSVAAVSIVKIRAAADSAEQLYQDNVGAITNVAAVRGSFRTYKTKVMMAGLAPAAAQKDAWAAVDTAWTAVDKALNDPRPFTEQDPVRAGIQAEIDRTLRAYNTFAQKELAPLAAARDTAGFYAAATGTGDKTVAPAVAAIDRLFEMEQAESAERAEAASAAGRSATIQVVIVLLLGLAFAALLAWRIILMILRPLQRVSHVLDGLAEGDLTRTTGVHQGDETGQMAALLDRSTASLRSAMAGVGANATSLASATEEFTAVTHTLAASAQQVSGNVQTVAAGAEQMGASISEIAASASRAVDVAGDAVAAAGQANAMVEHLGRSSAEIGSVIDTIADLADQTNVLALNATIEAARAGSAGYGFAVVADEVKQLAHQTTRATSDIGERIRAIQSDVAAAVAAIGEIGGVVDTISTHQATIAAAVEEQTAVTSEMARNVHDAALGVGEIAGDGTGGGGLAEMGGATDDLSRMSAELQDLVVHFRY